MKYRTHQNISTNGGSSSSEFHSDRIDFNAPICSRNKTRYMNRPRVTKSNPMHNPGQGAERYCEPKELLLIKSGKVRTNSIPIPGIPGSRSRMTRCGAARRPEAHVRSEPTEISSPNRDRNRRPDKDSSIRLCEDKVKING